VKHQNEYRDRAVVEALARRVHELVRRPVRIMELCGTHTMAIARHGLTSLLPQQLSLISGPGCPVCVTATEEIDRAMKLARSPGVIVATFGDMLRVPGSEGSLAQARAQGAHVEVVYSALEALELARANPDAQVVMLAIGFETTAPTLAASVLTARAEGLANYSLLVMHKLIPPAIRALLASGEVALDGLLCPGHVSTVIGSRPYEFAARDYFMACVISGFEPVDIMASLVMLLEQIAEGRPRVEIQYARAVRPEGNPKAVEVMNQVFEPLDAPWRGLGVIPMSGLKLREEFAAFDAARRFDLSVPPPRENPACRCGEVLKGLCTPPECPLFATACTPARPVGPCMVSSEGSCAAWYRYRRQEA